MEKHPLVTVVTPSYNQRDFLERAIASVLSQDYPRIEYIIIDGGSTDGSVELIRQYEHRLAYWQSRPDGGQAAAVNRGWARATGAILAFLNSDDEYLPGAIRTAVEAFERHPEAGVVNGQGHWITEGGEILHTTNIHAEPAQAMLDALASLPQPATFVRRAVVERVGLLDESLHYALDKEFFLRAVGNFPAVTMDVPLACLRVHGSAKSVASGAGFGPEILRVAGKIIANAASYPRFHVDRRRVLAAAHQLAAEFLYMHSDYRGALHSLRTAVSIDRRRRSRILLRTMPRLMLRRVAGLWGYLRLSAYYHRARATLAHRRSARTRPASRARSAPR